MYYIKGKSPTWPFKYVKNKYLLYFYNPFVKKNWWFQQHLQNCLASLKISKTTTKFDVPKMNDLSWAKFELQLRNIITMMSVAFLEISRYKISWKCICVRNQRKNAAFEMPASSASNWIQLSCQISSLSSFVAFTLPQMQLLLSSF